MAKPQWAGKDIGDESDADGLEREAAKHQFGAGLSREQADNKAYDAYKREQHAKGAAHHLMAAQHAVSLGDKEVAAQNQAYYDMHVAALGHKKSVVPPAEVRVHIQTNRPFDRVSKFRNHSADKLLGS